MAIWSFCSFSRNGKYYACCTVDGKLKIWETSTNALKQEYIPSQHLSDQLSCVLWISIPSDDVGLNQVLSPSARKKKRKSEVDASSSEMLALGTIKGSIILYCVASGRAVGKLTDGHSRSVNDLSFSLRRNSLFSVGDDKLVIEWDVNQRTIKRKWKAGGRALNSVLDLEDGESILIANSSIEWWDVDNKERLKTFTGHSSNINQLKYVPPVTNGKPHFLSSSREERVVSVWALDYDSAEKNSCATFTVIDSPEYLSVAPPTEDATTMLAVVTVSGVLQFFHHSINGVCPRPIKSSLTVSVKDGDESVPIVGAHMDQDGTALIAYGSSNILVFERVSTKSATPQLNLVRDLKKKHVKEARISKVKIPEQVDTNYLSVVRSGSLPGKNRKKYDDEKDIEAQLPMEERLSNLALLSQRTASGNEKPPMAVHSAQLLLQGLHSKDKSILHSIFLKKECNEVEWIRNTVMRLPVSAVVPLVRELTQLIQRKGCLALAGLNWLHVILVVHGSHLLATGCEELVPLMAIVETRLPLLPHLQRLRGRLDLLLKREGFTDQGISLAEPVQEAALLYCDGSSDEESMGNDVRALSSDSDNWDEDSEEDDVDSTGKDSEIDDKDIEDDGDG